MTESMKNEDAAAVSKIVRVLVDRAQSPSTDPGTRARDAQHISDQIEMLSEGGARLFHRIVGQLIAIVEVAEGRFDQSEFHGTGGTLPDGTPFVAIGNSEMPYPNMEADDLIEWLQAGRPEHWEPGQKAART